MQTLTDMARRLLAAGIQPVFMTLPPIDAERYLREISRRGADQTRVLQWLGDTQRIYRGEEKTILFGLTGTGYFDMTAYEAYLNGTMTDHVPTDEELQKGFDSLPQIPQNQL